MLYDLCPRHRRQGSLLSLARPEQETARQRSERLMAALDAVNARYGRHSVHFAGEGLDPNATWRMRQKHRSPRFTTAWEDLAVVK